ncbi:retrovirus-related pol polyprotein LINE-1 [Tanacetum coccineum]
MIQSIPLYLATPQTYLDKLAENQFVSNSLIPPYDLQRLWSIHQQFVEIDSIGTTMLLRVFTIGSLTSKLLELVDALERHGLDITCFQETKWKGSSNKEVNGYKLWYSGSHTARNGVRVILRACLKDKVVHVNRCSDRIISLTLVIEGETVNMISAYAPQVGLSEEEKKAFWDSLDEVVRESSTDERLILGGDLNGHIEVTTEGYSGVYGGFGYGVRNEEGDLKTCKDCKVFPGEACSSQHRLLAMDTLFKRVQRRRVGNATPRILLKNLNGDAAEAFRSRVSEGVSAQIEAIFASDANSMWNFLASIIKDATKDSLGEALGSSKTHTARRESWWVCEEVQYKVAEKQARFRELLSCQEGNLEERLRAQERYKLAKREAKKAVAQAKEKAYEDLYKKLDSKEGANEIFRIAKARQRRRRDLGDICFIKDEGGRTVTDEEEIKQIWGEYFSSLFNTGEPEGHEGVVDQNTLPLIDCYYSRISQTEVRTAIQKMGRNKAVGPDQIPIEAWRSLGAEGISWLTSLFNKIFTSAKMPEEWRLSDVIPIFKNKGDAQVCSNYRGIKLLSHTMKLWERVIERRERQRDVHLAFIDLEKAYDSVPRDLIWKTLIDKGASRRYIKVIRDMYNGAKTRVRTSIGNTEFFSVEVGLHQGSAISPYLFALILDELSRGIQEDIPWCMIFADDIVLVSESAEGLNDRLENWREALEANGLRVSREKTKYLRCDFSNSEIAHNKEVEVCIGDKILQPKESFRYLGSMLYKSGRIDEDVAHRIKAAWLKPAMLYGSECWPITKALANRMEVAERRPQSAPVRRVEALVVDGMRRRGRPKLRWEDRVKLDMKELLLSDDMTSNRNAWRAKTSFACEWFACLVSFLLFLFGFCVLDSDRLERWASIRLGGSMEGFEGLVGFGLPLFASSSLALWCSLLPFSFACIAACVLPCFACPFAVALCWLGLQLFLS